MRLILDRTHRYVGYHGTSNGDCRVRLFISHGDDVAADAQFDPMDPHTWGDRLTYTDPVILITDEGDNKGTSVTNAIELIVAEVLMDWRREQYEGQPCPASFVVIQENAPQDGVNNHSDYALVTFKTTEPQKTIRHCGLTAPWRWTLLDAVWKYLTEDQVLSILGEAFTRYPSLSHRHPIAEPKWAQEKFGSRSGVEQS